MSLFADENQMTAQQSSLPTFTPRASSHLSKLTLRKASAPSSARRVLGDLTNRPRDKHSTPATKRSIGFQSSANSAKVLDDSNDKECEADVERFIGQSHCNSYDGGVRTERLRINQMSLPYEHVFEDAPKLKTLYEIQDGFLDDASSDDHYIANIRHSYSLDDEPAFDDIDLDSLVFEVVHSDEERPTLDA